MADAEVTTLGVAESCLNCSNISRYRYLNTVSAYVLHDAYQEYLQQVPDGSHYIGIEQCAKRINLLCLDTIIPFLN